MVYSCALTGGVQAKFHFHQLCTSSGQCRPEANLLFQGGVGMALKLEQSLREPGGEGFGAVAHPYQAHTSQPLRRRLYQRLCNITAPMHHAR
eukprot:1188078-Prorocentrum_minimum.AAC.2